VTEGFSQPSQITRQFSRLAAVDVAAGVAAVFAQLAPILAQFAAVLAALLGLGRGGHWSRDGGQGDGGEQKSLHDVSFHQASPPPLREARPS